MQHGMLQSKGGASFYWGRLCNSELCDFLNVSSCTLAAGKAGSSMTRWLCHFSNFMRTGWAKALLREALEEKCNGVRLYTRWETLNNAGWELARKANPSQPVGHQEVRLPTSLGSGKVQPHSIRQIRETGLGEKKNWMVGTDECMGERVKLVGRRSPKEWDHGQELPGKKEGRTQSGAAFIYTHEHCAAMWTRHFQLI